MALDRNTVVDAALVVAGVVVAVTVDGVFGIVGGGALAAVGALRFLGVVDVIDLVKGWVKSKTD